MHYIRDIEYINRNGTPLYIQLLLPDDINDLTPLIVFVNGSAFHWQNIEQSIPVLNLLVNKGIAIASVQYRSSETALKAECAPLIRINRDYRGLCLCPGQVSD